ncbi:MAG: FMN-binding negative transcriptional regulator [Flavobacteriaceae bacterium]|nr:FMN-binding negative transcriptional regulator [Flavobacteriaceae bacterium]
MNNYPPPYHQSNDRQKMIAIIKQYPLAMLVSVKDDKPLITHLPVIFNEETGKLLGHIDLNNPQANLLKDNKEVTLVFKGSDTYISPSVYTTEQLPTWNYIIVHITGNVTAITNPEKAKQTMVSMTEFLEAPDHKFQLTIDNPKMDKFIHYIHAFEIEITHWEGKFKLSQDKFEQDQENAKQELIKKSNEDIIGFINTIYK